MQQRIPLKKIVLFFVTLSICLAGIAARLAYLQVFQTLTLFKLSQKNFLRFEKIISPRGNIVDRNNQLLATNRPVISLYWQGTGNKQLTQEQLLLLATIVQHLPEITINETALLEAEKLNKQHLLFADVPFENQQYVTVLYASYLVQHIADFQKGHRQKAGVVY